VCSECRGRETPRGQERRGLHCACLPLGEAQRCKPTQFLGTRATEAVPKCSPDRQRYTRDKGSISCRCLLGRLRPLEGFGSDRNREATAGKGYRARVQTVAATKGPEG